MGTTVERIVANLVGKVRREKLHGRDYLVAPISLIVPGVLNGSKGPHLYPQDEIERTYEAWNNMPIVVNHPTDPEGGPVSARDPEVLNKYGIGYVFRTSSGNKLTAEGWFDVARTKAVEPRIHTALERNQRVELSTGLYLDSVPAPQGAVYNGLSYSYVARNYRPDHLAILPDTVGACSIKDGCGLNVNEGIYDGLTENARREMSFAERRDKIESAFRDLYPYKYSMDGSPIDNWYVSEIYDSYLIARNREELRKFDYSMTKEGVVTVDKAGIEVKRVTTYEPVKNELSDNPTKGVNDYPLIVNQGENSMTPEQKKQIIDGLISNCGCSGPKVFNEADRDYLSKLPDERLTAMDESRKRIAANELIVANAKKGITAGNQVVTLNDKGEFQAEPKQDDSLVDNLSTANIQPGDTVEAVLVGNQTKYKINRKAAPTAPIQNTAPAKPVTDDEWLKNAPPRIRASVQNAMRIEDEQRNTLADQILANENNPYTKEQLLAMDLQMLTNMARLAGTVTASESPPTFPVFTGAAAPASSYSKAKFVENEDADMAPPEFDWKADRRQKTA